MYEQIPVTNVTLGTTSSAVSVDGKRGVIVGVAGTDYEIEISLSGGVFYQFAKATADGVYELPPCKSVQVKALTTQADFEISIGQ